MRFRDLVRSPAVQSALERSSDTFPAFTLRAAERVLGDQSRADREIIDRLWDVFDDLISTKPWGCHRIPASRSDHIQRDVRLHEFTVIRCCHRDARGPSDRRAGSPLREQKR
jgi:hypothetical protein